MRSHILLLLGALGQDVEELALRNEILNAFSFARPKLTNVFKRYAKCVCKQIVFTRDATTIEENVCASMYCDHRWLLCLEDETQDLQAIDMCLSQYERPECYLYWPDWQDPREIKRFTTSVIQCVRDANNAIAVTE